MFTCPIALVCLALRTPTSHRNPPQRADGGLAVCRPTNSQTFGALDANLLCLAVRLDYDIIEPGARFERHTDHIGIRLLATGLLLLISCLAACSNGATNRATPTSTTAASTTTTPSQARRSRPFAVRIELPASVIVGGSQVTGHLVVDNNTAAALNLLSGGNVRCTPKWAVTLGNNKIPPGGAFAADCGSRPLVIRRGENHFPFTIDASYDHCGGTDIPGPIKPACVGSPPTAPPLPPDRYQAVFIGDLPGLPKPAAVPVRVVVSAPPGNGADSGRR
jgi:hypothetical protein